MVMFIDDTGVVHYTSTAFLKGLLEGRINHFIHLRRFKEIVQNGRFPKSEIFEFTKPSSPVTDGMDVLLPQINETKSEIAAYEDKDVW